MIKRYKEKIKKHFEEVVHIKTSPHSVALGFAIGTAIAVLPTFGTGALIGLVIVLIFKRISKLGLFAGFAIWNPLVLFSLYSLSYKIGDFLLRDIPAKTYRLWVFNTLYTYTKRFLIGNLIITITASILGYILVYLLIRKYQKQYKEFVKEPLEEIISEVEGKISEGKDGEIKKESEKIDEAIEKI